MVISLLHRTLKFLSNQTPSLYQPHYQVLLIPNITYITFIYPTITLTKSFSFTNSFLLNNILMTYTIIIIH